MPIRRYLDCHAAGLCCYLVMHIESLLRQLQLFYFHLWPIYRFSLVIPRSLSQKLRNVVCHIKGRTQVVLEQGAEKNIWR
jgi:hypothetical protein